MPLLIAAQRLMRFEPRGEHWTLEHPLEGPAPQCLAHDPGRPERLYCGTVGDGLWRSDDVGRTWQPVGPGIGQPHIMSLAVRADERQAGLGTVYAGTEPSAVYRSGDGGDTWQPCPGLQDLPSKPTWSYPPRPETHHVRQIGLDTGQPGRLYVCIENGALVISPDGGRTWQDRTPDSPKDTHTIATHPAAPGRIYACAGDGFGRPGHAYAESADGGASWTYPDAGLEAQYGWGLALDPGDPDTVLVSVARSPNQAHNPTAAQAFVYRRVGGGPWQPVTTGLPGPDGSLAAVLRAPQPGVFYAASNLGVARSDDAGQSFTALDLPWHPGMRFQHVQDLLALPD